LAQVILLILLDFPSCSALSDLVRQVQVLWKPRHSADWWVMMLWQ